MAWRYFGLQMQSQTSHWLPSHAWGDLLDKKGRSTLEETQPSSWQRLSSRPEEMSQQVISSLTKTWPTYWWAMASHLLELSEPTRASCQKRSKSRKGNSSMSLHLFSKKSWPWSTTRANQTKTLWSWAACTTTKGLTLWHTKENQTLYVSTMPQGGLSMPWIKWHMCSQPKGSQNDGPWSFFSTWPTSVPLLHV